MKQVRFVDTDSKDIHSGILLDDGSVVCGCCGGLFEPDEVGTAESKDSECSIRILETYADWVNLDDWILEWR